MGWARLPAPVPALGILAGGGQLPGPCRRRRRAPPAARCSSSAWKASPNQPCSRHGRTNSCAWARPAASLPRCARTAASDLVLIGPVRRPSLLDLRPDAEGARILARIGRAAFAGDDGLLAAVIRVLGEEGFRVLGAHEILNEALGAGRPADARRHPTPAPWPTSAAASR